MNVSVSGLMRWLRAFGCLSVTLLFVAGCVETTVESFRRVPESRADEAFVKPGVDFSRYRQLQAVPLEIYYYEGQQPPLAEDLDRVRSIFREAFLEAIGDDYQLVQEAGPDVLGVRASLVDLKLSPALGTLPVKGRAAHLVANGELTFFMELTDSVSGEVLARAADQEKSPMTAAASGGREWEETEVAAQRWAAMFRAFLDENLAR